MKRLAAFLERAHATEVTFVPFNRTYGVLAGHAFPAMHPGDPAHPSPGWNAVSVSVSKIFRVPSPRRVAHRRPRTLVAAIRIPAATGRGFVAAVGIFLRAAIVGQEDDERV